jgi:hypothetical protein
MPCGGNCIPLKAEEQAKSADVGESIRDANVGSGSRIAFETIPYWATPPIMMNARGIGTEEVWVVLLLTPETLLERIFSRQLNEFRVTEQFDARIYRRSVRWDNAHCLSQVR